ncbi:pyridoxal phosphate-dependent decarboxylase family protein [Streptomyces sp. H39-C1]|uniref:pyridoxal phosphate-dependent decarboxylase family protein n=1 Tax=Streptomyces sp. H39-C1 TaxID=3004355 RepID=UPI0022B00352|nr:aminotransferase class I/II-fold pyridoxal phosphate-dependent enzyme [Streptomyces sp. H39-C1]MCZ4096968.1 aminotransferase class I/II-fold pyridoxal phosphate-dependent enzyme [Streptomyces sp. H39-C1]
MEKDHGSGPGRPADALGMTPKEMRRLGHLVVDLVVDHCESRADGPAIQQGTPEELRAVLGGPVPEVPGDADRAIRTLVDTALANMQHGDHPRYFARVPGPSSFAAVLGEWLGTGHNAIATSWGGGSGPTTVELVVVDWLRELLGMPEGTDGILVSGGSLANLTAFATARAELGDGVAYLTDQTHSSIARDLRALGFPPDHVRVLRSDEQLRMPVGELAAAVAADRAAGRRPLMVVATAGTTNTGTVDPLPEIADLCRAEGLWFHIDGAYGAPAALSATGAAALAGMERADSLVIDPHKWLFQPYDVGCVLVRRPGALERAFTINAEYLNTSAAGGEVNLRDRSLELSRRSRALKLWLTFRVYGAAGIRAAISQGIALAEFTESRLRADPRWEVVTPAQLGVVTFALTHGGDGAHATRAASLAASGYAAVTSTTVHGRSVLRLCTINPTTTEDDIIQTLDRLATP